MRQLAKNLSFSTEIDNRIHMTVPQVYAQQGIGGFSESETNDIGNSESAGFWMRSIRVPQRDRSSRHDVARWQRMLTEDAAGIDLIGVVSDNPAGPQSCSAK
jgi:hypothetical protein